MEKDFLLYLVNIQKTCKKKTMTVRWSTIWGEFNTKYTSKLEIALPELDATKIVVLNIHLDYLQGN